MQMLANGDNLIMNVPLETGWVGLSTTPIIVCLLLGIKSATEQL